LKPKVYLAWVIM